MAASNRNELRSRIRQQRRDLSIRQRRDAARSLERALMGLPLFQHSRHIAFYLPNDGEIDPVPLIQRAWSMGKRCYLPVLSPQHHNRLWFAPFEPDSPLYTNCFGIAEPHCTHRQLRSVHTLDLVLTPLVAFDKSGNRLGMGGGFYDRTFAYLNRRNRWQKPKLLGVAYSFQEVAEIPTQAWDIPLCGIVTEQGMQWAESKAGK